MHGAHWTHDTSLPVSTTTVCRTAGVPKPTVTTYSSESTASPMWLGITTFSSSRALAAPRDAVLAMELERARFWRSISGKDGLSVDCHGAHGPWRCTSGTDTVLLWLCSRFTEK